jgi:hypothetical protein
MVRRPPLAVLAESAFGIAYTIGGDVIEEERPLVVVYAGTVAATVVAEVLRDPRLSSTRAMVERDAIAAHDDAAGRRAARPESGDRAVAIAGRRDPRLPAGGERAPLPRRRD